MTPSTKRKKFFKKEKRTSRLSKLAPSVAPSDADFDNPPDLGQDDDIEVSFFSVVDTEFIIGKHCLIIWAVILFISIKFGKK